VCPEVEVGLPTPRPSLRLVRIEGDVRLVIPKEERDITEEMRAYARERVAALAAENLRGYILKKDSPSCGMTRVRIYVPSGPAERSGRGMFAETLLERFPCLPVEEEGRLHDPRLRENWITRVFAYHRLQRLWSDRWKIGHLVAFHADHKFLLLAHSPKIFQELGRLIAAAKDVPRNELQARYESQFMTALAKVATPARNANVLGRILGFFRKELDRACRTELLGLIEDYRRGIVPLVVPLTLVAHYVRILSIDYLRNQVFLNPHPRELALRNHV
jgi:uncharacterized protein YbgA (DUF1722 family)/uncharacterized protein YbbK (DUF523 family)